MNQIYLTTAEIKEETHIDERMIKAFRECGLLKMARYGKTYGTTRAELDRFLDWCLGKEFCNADDVYRYAKGSGHATSALPIVGTH